jgi:uncharacterized membrane protein (UPF0136 family)
VDVLVLSKGLEQERTIMKQLGKISMLSGVVVVGSVLTAAFSLAQSASDEVIFACVDRHGTLRIVDSEHCRHGESSLSWNRQGPPGPQGVPGPAGAAGPAGPPGAPGGSGGTLVSPNGDFVVSVEDSGITLAGGGSTILLTSGGITISSPSQLILQSGSEIAVEAANRVSIEAAAEITLTAAIIRQN